MIARPPTIYIDPGVKYLGFCKFANGRMQLAGLLKRENAPELAEEAERCIVEIPWGKGKHTTLDDIMRLCIAAGEYGSLFPDREYIKPYRLPKPLRHARALDALDADETKRLPWQKTYRQHTLCAVYMALRDVGRTP